MHVCPSCGHLCGTERLCWDVVAESALGNTNCSTGHRSTKQDLKGQNESQKKARLHRTGYLFHIQHFGSKSIYTA